MDAINAKKLNATRSNRNYWVISAVDLKAWMDSRGVKPKPDTSSDAFSDTSSNTITQLKVENRVLEVQLKASADTIIDLKQRLLKVDADLRETVTDLKIQREDWKAQGEDWKAQSESWKAQGEDWKAKGEDWKAKAQQLLKDMDSKNVEDKSPPPLMLTNAHKTRKPQTDTPEPQSEPLREQRKRIFGIF